ncbi:unnamed protein product [Victoria cruziana]
MAAAASSATFDYDVFLSFCGEDTRCGFADHLYRAFCRSGVRAFRDEVLDKGTNIDNIFGVIERSKVFVPIFSCNYAHSEWCLMEIDKIMKVADEGEEGRLIIPVFYKINPTHVHHQTGEFGAAFLKYEKKTKNKRRVKEWREALKKASKIAVYESSKMFDGHEAPLVEQIVWRILRHIRNNIGEDDVVQHHVGIKSRVRDILKILDLGSKDWWESMEWEELARRQLQELCTSGSADSLTPIASSVISGKDPYAPKEWTR